MSFTGVNYIAVIIAALAGFGLGAVWYMVLSKPWMDAVGKTEVDCREARPRFFPSPLPSSALFVMALMLAGLMGHIGDVTSGAA